MLSFLCHHLAYLRLKVHPSLSACCLCRHFCLYLIVSLLLPFLQAVNTDIESRKPSVKAVNDAGANSNDNGDTIDSELMKELDGVNSRYDAVSKDAVQLLMALKDALDRTERFEKDVQKLAAWISDVEEKLNEEKRVGGVPDTCRQQLADLEVPLLCNYIK